MSKPFITKEDVNQLRDYVMASDGRNQAESTILLHVTHSNLQARFFELRLDLHVSDCVHALRRNSRVTTAACTSRRMVPVRGAALTAAQVPEQCACQICVPPVNPYPSLPCCCR